MKKLKVLQFPIANSNGGITHYILENWKWMDKELFQCDFATMSKHLDFADEILATGSKIFYISCYAEDNKNVFMKEFDGILGQGYDVVHLHTKQWKSLAVEELCKKHKIPKVIVHSHSTGIDVLDDERRECERNIHEKVKREFNESIASDFWACSKAASDFLFGEQISREKIKIMPNAIDLDKFLFNQYIREKYRKRYELNDCFVIGHVGRFEYPKNHEFLLDVFYEVLKQINNAKLILIGDGQLYQQMREKVKYLDMEENVLFVGKRNDVNCWYQAMDVFCLPSRFEGLSISSIEAQASGVPCIVSDCVTEETKICSNIELLPLKRALWVDGIIKNLNIKRSDNKAELIQHGYSIKNQIKNIEKEYMK